MGITFSAPTWYTSIVPEKETKQNSNILRNLNIYLDRKYPVQRQVQWGKPIQSRLGKYVGRQAGGRQSPGGSPAAEYPDPCRSRDCLEPSGLGTGFTHRPGIVPGMFPPATSIPPRQFYRDTIRILILFPLFFNSPTVYCPAGSCANACLSHLSYSHSETAIVDSRIQTVYPYRVHISPSESKRYGSHLLCKDSDAFSFNTRQEGGTVQYIITGSDRFALFRIKTQVRAESHSTTQYKKISGSHRNTRFPGVLL